MPIAKPIRLLCVTDTHLRRSRPALRTDNYFQAMENKLEFILETAAADESCVGIAFAGDVFDSYDVPHGLVEWAISKFKSKRGLLYFFVFGQHDLRYHASDKKNSPLGVLIAALGEQASILVPDHPYVLEAFDGYQIQLWGCSWGEEIPKVTKIDGQHGCNVLVLHRPITKEPLPWEHSDLLTVKQLAAASPNMDIFVSGDNHKQFISAVGKKSQQIIFNMGSMMRNSVDQITHEPAVAMITFGQQIIYDTVLLPIRSIVFDLDKVEQKKEQDVRVAAFVAGLQQDFDATLSFKQNIQAAAESVPKGVRSILDEILS